MAFIRVSAAILLAGSLFAASPAWSQATEPVADEQGDSDRIVVTGRADEEPTAGEVTRQARSISQGGDFRHTPLARFEGRLCPGIVGMKPEYAALMIDRIRANAERLDITLGDDTGCRPNLIVAFVEDGQKEIQLLADNHSYLFSSMAMKDRTELLTETGPVRVWTTTSMRTRDGMPVATGTGLDDPPVVNTWMAHSKIYSAIRTDIDSTVVLFNRQGVAGKTLVQLADYATMRGIARTRPVSDGQPLDTILALFDQDGSPPPTMTDFDFAYLGSLYDGIANLPGSVRVLGVSRQLRLQAAAEERE